MRSPQTRRAFTLVELLAACAVMAVLLTLSLSALMRVREASGRATCANNLMQLGVAVHAYHFDRGQLPPYASGGNVYGGWFIFLLPYVEQTALYEKICSDNATADTMISTVSDDGVRDVRFPLLICPSDPTAYDTSDDTGRTSYLANWFAFTDGTRGAYSRPRRFNDLSDGLTNVVLFAEAYSICDSVPRVALFSEGYHNFGITAEAKPSDDASYLPNDYTMFQTKPSASTCHSWRTQTPHEVMQIGMADGSVHGVAEAIGQTVWKQLLKPRDGLPTGGF